MTEPEHDVGQIVATARSVAVTLEHLRFALERPLVTDLSPWELWPLIAFLRHERRQQWVAYIVESKLKAAGRELGSAGSFSHPEEARGAVPDMPEWSYYFHGCGCCLQHTDGTVLDVDFGRDGSALEIDPYFLNAFLDSAPSLDWSDERLRRAEPLATFWHFAIGRLAELGFLTRDWRFRLTDKGRDYATRLEPLADEINALARKPTAAARRSMGWLLTLLGDTPAAAALLATDESDVLPTLRVVAANAIERRAALARDAARSEHESERRLGLIALAALGRAHAEPDVWRILHQPPPDSVHLLALRLIEAWQDASCEAGLIEALNRFDPAAGFVARWFGGTAEPPEIERPRNGFLVGAAKLLMSYHSPGSIDHEKTVLLRRVLEADRGAMDAEAGWLLFLLCPERGVTKLAANLRNSIPITRVEAAVFLGMIGSEAALDALVRAAEGPPEHGGHEAACVLSILADKRATEAAVEWSRRNDGYEAADPHEIMFNGRKIKTWKVDDMLRTTTRDTVQDWSERLQDNYSALLSVWRPTTK